MSRKEKPWESMGLKESYGTYFGFSPDHEDCDFCQEANRVATDEDRDSGLIWLAFPGNE